MKTYQNYSLNLYPVRYVLHYIPVGRSSRDCLVKSKLGMCLYQYWYSKSPKCSNIRTASQREPGHGFPAWWLTCYLTSCCLVTLEGSLASCKNATCYLKNSIGASLIIQFVVSFNVTSDIGQQFSDLQMFSKIRKLLLFFLT